MGTGREEAGGAGDSAGDGQGGGQLAKILRRFWRLVGNTWEQRGLGSGVWETRTAPVWAWVEPGGLWWRNKVQGAQKGQSRLSKRRRVKAAAPAGASRLSPLGRTVVAHPCARFLLRVCLFPLKQRSVPCFASVPGVFAPWQRPARLDTHVSSSLPFQQRRP